MFSFVFTKLQNFLEMFSKLNIIMEQIFDPKVLRVIVRLLLT